MHIKSEINSVFNLRTLYEVFNYNASTLILLNFKQCTAAACVEVLQKLETVLVKQQ